MPLRGECSAWERWILLYGEWLSTGILVAVPSVLFTTITEQQWWSCCPPPPCRLNSRAKGLVIKERSLYWKASQFWNNRFPHELVTQAYQFRLNSNTWLLLSFSLLVFSYFYIVSLLTKATYYTKSYTILEECQVSASEPVPYRTPKEKTCCPLPGQPDSRLCREFLPIQIPVRWEMQAAEADHPGILEEESPRAMPLPRAWQCFSFQTFWPIVPCALEAVRFSANPVLDCLPLPWQTPPKLLPTFPSDLTRSINTRNTSLLPQADLWVQQHQNIEGWEAQPLQVSNWL